MKKDRPTVYEDAISRGITRRQFLTFCTTMAAYLGLEHSAVGQVVKALETKPKVPVLWFNFQECTCCTESFIRSSHPTMVDILFDKISLDYNETLMAAAGEQAEEALQNAMKEYKGEYIMAIEGSIPMGNPGYCCIGGKSAIDILKDSAKNAKAVICWGNCAFHGCVQSAKPNPTGATAIQEIITNKPLVNVPGCPPIPAVMAGVIVYMLTFGTIPELDGMKRPLTFYSRRVHDTCYRRANYDAGLFVQSFDDENAKKGYCLYKMGCKGPNTYNSCGVIKWNDGVSYPIQSGHPCIGCAEPGFFDFGPLYSHLPKVGGFGIEANADQIGAVVGAGTLAGILVHAVRTNIRKHKLIQDGEIPPDKDEVTTEHESSQNKE